MFGIMAGQLPAAAALSNLIGLRNSRMNAFEFGYVVGSFEKQAAPIPTIIPGMNPQNFRLAAGSLATIPGKGVVNSPLRDFLRRSLAGAQRIGGVVGRDIRGALPGRELLGTLGTGGVLGGMLGNSSSTAENVGRGVGYTAGASLGGGLGAGLGKSVSRLLPQKYQAAAQIAGGIGGMGLGLRGAHRLMGQPKQAGVMEATQAVVDKGKKAVGVANSAAKGVANAAVGAGDKMKKNFDSWRNSKSC